MDAGGDRCADQAEVTALERAHGIDHREGAAVSKRPRRDAPEVQDQGTDTGHAGTGHAGTGHAGTGRVSTGGRPAPKHGCSGRRRRQGGVRRIRRPPPRTPWSAAARRPGASGKRRCRRQPARPEARGSRHPRRVVALGGACCLAALPLGPWRCAECGLACRPTSWPPPGSGLCAGKSTASPPVVTPPGASPSGPSPQRSSPPPARGGRWCGRARSTAGRPVCRARGRSPPPARPAGGRPACAP